MLLREALNDNPFYCLFLFERLPSVFLCGFLLGYQIKQSVMFLWAFFCYHFSFSDFCILLNIFKDSIRQFKYIFMFMVKWLEIIHLPENLMSLGHSVTTLEMSSWAFLGTLIYLSHLCCVHVCKKYSILILLEIGAIGQLREFKSILRLFLSDQMKKIYGMWRHVTQVRIHTREIKISFGLS